MTEISTRGRSNPEGDMRIPFIQLWTQQSLWEAKHGLIPEFKKKNKNNKKQMQLTALKKWKGPWNVDTI